MSKEEIIKLKTCTLKVYLHCDECTRQVRKTLQKIEGVYIIKIDQEQNKVTVSGDIDPEILIKKLKKSGKPASILGNPVPNPQINDQFEKMSVNSSKGSSTGNGGGKGASSSSVTGSKAGSSGSGVVGRRMNEEIDQSEYGDDEDDED